ncbi:MAG: ATP-binding cassette domain-containing protein [Treponema sp.]
MPEKSLIKNLFINIHPLSLVLYSVCIILISVCDIVIPIFEGKMIDSLWNKELQNSLYFLLTAGCILLNGFAYFCLYVTFTKIKNDIIKNISCSTFQRLVLFNRKNIAHKGTGVYTSFLSREPEQLACCADPSGLFFLVSIIVAAAALGISLQWSYSFLFVFPPTIAAYCFFDYFFSQRLKKITQALVALQYSVEPQFITYIDNAKTILKFGNNKHYWSKLEHLEQQSTEFKKKYVFYKELKTGLSEILSAIAFIVFICIASQDIMTGKITYGGFTVLLSYFGFILVPVAYHGKYKMIVIDAEHSYELLNKIYAECRQEIKDYHSINLLMSPVLSAKDICFSYSEHTVKGENMQFDYSDISFSLKEGDSLGFVGISGEGKSTIVKLLLGELRPSAGSITINGCDIFSIPQPILNHLMCVYEQTSTVINGSLYENICLGREMTDSEQYAVTFNSIKAVFERAVSQKKWCAELSELFGIPNGTPRQMLAEEKQFVTSFYSRNPNPEFLAQVYCDMILVNKDKVDSLIASFGLEHLHGRNLGENGSDISGGEKERIAMVRFLTKEHALFYLIDEPFTSLDSKTEEDCLNLLCTAMRGKTLVVISHKFNVLRTLTKECAVLKNGRILEYGTHAELEKKGSLYAELLHYFTMQRDNTEP